MIDNMKEKNLFMEYFQPVLQRRKKNEVVVSFFKGSIKIRHTHTHTNR